jgi:hypothetical protein
VDPRNERGCDDSMEISQRTILARAIGRWAFQIVATSPKFLRR